MSGSLWPHGLQHARLSCSSLSSGVAQTHVHWVNDSIQLSHPLSFPSPALSLPQHQGVFQWVSSLHQVVKILELQQQSFQWVFRVDFQWIFRADFLEDGLVGSPCCSRDSQESSLAPQFKSINSLALSVLYGPTLTSNYWKNESWEKCRTASSLTPQTVNQQAAPKHHQVNSIKCEGIHEEPNVIPSHWKFTAQTRSFQVSGLTPSLIVSF